MSVWRWLVGVLGWRRDLTAGWFQDQQRREWGRGIDQPCIDWDAMKRREL